MRFLEISRTELNFGARTGRFIAGCLKLFFQHTPPLSHNDNLIILWSTDYNELLKYKTLYYEVQVQNEELIKLRELDK